MLLWLMLITPMEMGWLAREFAKFLKNCETNMMPSFQKISIIGLGYIGLPTAAVFASRKVRVVGVDVNQHAVDTINDGRIHIIEPDLDMVVHAAVSEGYLRATTQAEPALTLPCCTKK